MIIRWHNWKLQPQIDEYVTIIVGIKGNLEFEVRHQDVKEAVRLAKGKADRINEEMKNDPSA